MIIGIGSDLIDIRRVAATLEKHDERFRTRVFTEIEQARSDRRKERAASYAKRFAAKEALAKALGTGIRGRFGWQSCAVANDDLGKPYWQFAPDFGAWLQAQHLQAHLSLSDEGDMVAAFCVIERLKQQLEKQPQTLLKH